MFPAAGGGRDGQKTWQWEGKQNFRLFVCLIVKARSNNAESVLVIISLIIQVGRYAFSLFQKPENIAEKGKIELDQALSEE